jgi:diketogulonate reductase-like aldo/keto reductase
VRAYQAVADGYGVPLAPVALAWVYSHPSVLSTLLGVSSAQQLKENVQALNFAPLSAQLRSDLETVRRKHLDPTKGVFSVIDPNTEYTDPSKLPWGAKDQDVDPELDMLIHRT